MSRKYKNGASREHLHEAFLAGWLERTNGKPFEKAFEEFLKGQYDDRPVPNFSGVKTVFLALALAMIGAFVYGESSGRIPVRMPPEIPSMVKPSKKSQQAEALRVAAQFMEEEARHDLEALGASVSTSSSNAQAKVNFSTEKFEVKLKSVAFMEVGTNLMTQTTFDYKEK